MLELAFALVSCLCGAVLVGSAWAWVELRRTNRTIAAAHLRLAREHVEQRAMWAKHDDALRKLEVARYDHNEDLKTLASHAGVKRYTRGGTEVE